MSLLGQIESILFVASKPLAFSRIAKAIGKNKADVEEAVENLQRKYNQDDSGIHVLVSGDAVQMATNPAHSEQISGFVKDEATGDLTKAQLETLTVIVYQGPITRPELEQVRGVNCSVILRNLLMRGLIKEYDDDEKILPVYELSVDALAHLGLKKSAELPDYETLSSHEYIHAALSAHELS